MTWAAVTKALLHCCPEALAPVSTPSLAPLADSFSGLLPTRFKPSLGAFVESVNEALWGTAAPPPPARGCLVIDGVSAHVKRPVSSHFPSSPWAPALCLITSKGLDTDNPGLEADKGKSDEDQALGEAPLGTQPGPGSQLSSPH